MKSKRLRRLQTCTIIVLFLYMLMLGNFLVNMLTDAIPFAVAMQWSQPMAERRIESDKTVQKLQSDLRFTAQNVSHVLQFQRKLLTIYFGASVAMIGFLGWSAFTMSRIGKEVDHDA